MGTLGVGTPSLQVSPSSVPDEDAVIFDDAVPGTNSNIRSDRAIDQSAIDNTKSGITNLGSDTTGVTPGATGNYATNGGGDQNQAAADYATIPGGFQNVVGGSFGAASGTGSTAGFAADARCSGTATGGGSCAVNSSIALGISSDASGSGGTAMGFASRVGGFVCLAAGNGSDAMGAFCQALGDTSRAMGESCVAAGESSDAQGFFCESPGLRSRAFGEYAQALRQGQMSHACGNFPGNVLGEAQNCDLHFYGQTPGAGVGESVELLGDTGNFFILEDGKGYTVKVSLIAGGVIGVARVTRSLELTANARRDAGVTTVTATGALSTFGDAGAATWTLGIAVAAAPDRLAITFTTGATTAATAVSARVEWEEVVYP